MIPSTNWKKPQYNSLEGKVLPLLSLWHLVFGILAIFCLSKEARFIDFFADFLPSMVYGRYFQTVFKAPSKSKRRATSKIWLIIGSWLLLASSCWIALKERNTLNGFPTLIFHVRNYCSSHRDIMHPQMGSRPYYRGWEGKCPQDNLVLRCPHYENVWASWEECNRRFQGCRCYGK